MKRILITLMWFNFMAIARAADIATTYHFSPDLSEEANILIVLFGRQWSILLLCNVLGFVVVGICMILYCRAKPRGDLLREAQSIWGFASLMLYGVQLGRAEFLRRRFFKFLESKSHYASLAQLAGFVFPPVITLMSLFCVFAWFATRQWRIAWFIAIHNQLGMFLFIIPAVFLWALMEPVYFSSEYRRARDSHYRMGAVGK